MPLLPLPSQHEDIVVARISVRSKSHSETAAMLPLLSHRQ